jgi:ABC-type sugar transport system substrate-binding protein
MTYRFTGLLAAASVAALTLGAGAASALDIAWVHSNAAAQSEQRVEAGFKQWLGRDG